MGAHELAVVGLAGSGLGTILGLPMVWPRARGGRDLQLFGFAVLGMSVIAALISARLAGLAPPSAATEHAINLLGLATLPALVLYTRDAVGARLTAAHLAWWLPAGGYIALISVLAAAGTDGRIPFAWLLPLVCSFTIASAVTLWRRRATRRNVVVRPELVIAFVAVINAAQIIRMMFSHINPVRAIVPVVMSLGFAALAAFAARRIALGPVPPSPKTIARYERSGLDESAARELLDRVDRALGVDRLHTRTDLTLAQLAAAVEATPHQLSEALNQYGRTSFAKFVMRRRVDDVKAQLVDPANDCFTIEGIGTSAGFGSRSALYTAFKRCRE
jgi:AraC-like DNA-binding protein